MVPSHQPLRQYEGTYSQEYFRKQCGVLTGIYFNNAEMEMVKGYRFLDANIINNLFRSQVCTNVSTSSENDENLDGLK